MKLRSTRDASYFRTNFARVLFDAQGSGSGSRENLGGGICRACTCEGHEGFAFRNSKKGSTLETNYRRLCSFKWLEV